MNDPIVQEVRKNRMEHTLRFAGNLDAICSDLRLLQSNAGMTVVRLRPKKIEPSASTLRRVPRRK